MRAPLTEAERETAAALLAAAETPKPLAPASALPMIAAMLAANPGTPPEKAPTARAEQMRSYRARELEVLANAGVDVVQLHGNRLARAEEKRQRKRNARIRPNA